MAKGKGEVPLEFDGQRYTLVFDMAAIAAFEDATDRSIFEVFSGMMQAKAGGKPPKLSVLGSLLQAGMVRNHPDVTREDAMAIVMNPAAQAALAGAFEMAMPKADDAAGTDGGDVDPPKGRLAE